MAKHARIVVTPPGPKARRIVEQTRQHLAPAIARYYSLVVDSAHGCIVTDVDGNKYIDMNAGIAVLSTGSTHPKVVEAVKKQAERFIHYSFTDFYYPEAVELASKLVETVPGDFAKQVFFTNSGAESIEAGMKLARYYTKRPRYLAINRAFHGRTMGSLSLTSSKPVHLQGFGPLIWGVDRVPTPYCYRCPLGLEYPSCGIACAKYVKEEMLEHSVPADEVAAFVFEPIMGEGGYIIPPKDYFKTIKRILEPHKILFMADEIQSGYGRTGRWWGYENYSILADIVCTAKGIASGLPIGAMIARSDIMTWPPGSHGSTFAANPICCAAALATIEVIKEEQLLENARRQGAFILKRLSEMKEKHEIIGDVRGLGLMIGAEVVKDKKTKAYGISEAKAIVERAWKNGVLLIGAGKSALRFSPPLTITQELADEALDIVEEAIAYVNRTSTT